MRKREQLEADSGRAVRDWMRAGGFAKPDRAFIFGTYEVEIDLHDESVCPWMRSGGFWESWVHVGLEALIRPGDYCVDLGAHCGYFTMLMAKASGPDGKVYAVEPQERLANIIRRNVDRNKLSDRVWVTQGAIARGGVKTVTMGTPGRLTGSTSVFHVENQFEAAGYSFDELFDGRVDVVKVDVEGSEIIVWDTSAEARARNPQSRWLMEVAHGRGYDMVEFLKRVEGEGYALEALTTDGDYVPFTTDDATDVGIIYSKNAPAGAYMEVLAWKRGQR